MSDHFVVGHRVLLDASFRDIRTRLGMLAAGGMLASASEAAYGEFVTGLVRAAGPAAGLTRLAATHLDQVADTYDCAHLTLRWEAIAADGTLFTALDADLMLAPAGGVVAALSLAGSYRLQPGPSGAWLDQTIARECATTAIRGFLAQVACALAHPAGQGVATHRSEP
jgi:hypothetical protein